MTRGDIFQNYTLFLILQRAERDAKNNGDFFATDAEKIWQLYNACKEGKITAENINQNEYKIIKYINENTNPLYNLALKTIRTYTTEGEKLPLPQRLQNSVRNPQDYVKNPAINLVQTFYIPTLVDQPNAEQVPMQERQV